MPDILKVFRGARSSIEHNKQTRFSKKIWSQIYSDPWLDSDYIFMKVNTKPWPKDSFFIQSQSQMESASRQFGFGMLPEVLLPYFNVHGRSCGIS